MTAPHSRRALAQVLLVTGKGGVGKTTLAAGFALEAARRDGSAIFVEFGDDESGKRVLRGSGSVQHRVIRPAEAIQEMSATLLHSALLAKVVTGNFAMRRLLRAAPALRELAQLEKVRAIAAQSPNTRVVVDMPATGHGIAWLRVPAQLRDMLRAGPLHKLSAQVASELLSPGRASVVVVTLPERLVLEETLELCEAFRHEVHLPPDRMIINRMPATFTEQAHREAIRLAQDGGALSREAAEFAELIATRQQAHEEALQVLGSASGQLDLSPVLLPEAPTDPAAAEVADWLAAEHAA